SIMGICNKAAGIMANLLFGTLLLKNADAIQKQLTDAAITAETKAQLLSDLANRVVMPYSVMAFFLAIVGIVIYRSSLPDISTQASHEADGDTELSRGRTSIFQFPHTLLGALAIFTYVGAEGMAGEVITIYGKNLG
ncbi:MAG: glucose/galactose MFS transporter, partial [Bacteroidota bacterium]